MYGMKMKRCKNLFLEGILEFAVQIVLDLRCKSLILIYTTDER